MTIAETIAQTTAFLPPHKQQEVLDFAQFLAQKQRSRKPRRDLYGIWKGITVTEEDISAMRNEAWGKYMGDSQ